MLALLRFTVTAGFATGLLFCGLLFRDPLIAKIRTAFSDPLIPLGVLLLSALVLIAFAAGRRSFRLGRPQFLFSIPERVLIVTLAATAVGFGLHAELSFRNDRALVYAASAEEIRGLGVHLVAGYREKKFAMELARHGFVGGLFVTARNARTKSRETFAAEIAQLQQLRIRNDLPLLWIATDQEGGHVSRLSPPLEQQPLLADVMEAAATGEIDSATRDYAAVQAAALQSVGVNVNLAPVADLRPVDRAPSVFDMFSRIERRALHSNARIVANAVSAYAAEFERRGVYATLKHFPGLGRVPVDTHFFDAHLRVTPEALHATDWLPFTETARSARAFVMLAHLHLNSVDAQRPASLSAAVVRLLREDVGHTGPVITDDLNMRPTFHGPGGIGGAAVESLNAGVDLLLVSYDGENVFPVLAALLRAKRAGRLNEKMLAESRERLEAYRLRLAR